MEWIRGPVEDRTSQDTRKSWTETSYFNVLHLFLKKDIFT